MAIAKGFQRKGQEVIFFLAEEKETKRLEDQNIPYIVLHSDWRNLEQEFSLLEELLEKYSITKLIVDSYQGYTEIFKEPQSKSKSNLHG